MAGVNVMEYRKVVFLKESASNASAREVWHQEWVLRGGVCRAAGSLVTCGAWGWEGEPSCTDGLKGFAFE